MRVKMVGQSENGVYVLNAENAKKRTGGLTDMVMQQQKPIRQKEYTWSDNLTDEIWRHGRFGSIEECVEDAIAEGKEPGVAIAIGICEDYVPSLNADVLLDQVHEDACENCGEVAEDWPEFAPRKGYKDVDELQEAIDKVFEEWLKKTNQVPSFYHVYPLANMVEIPGAKP